MVSTQQPAGAEGRDPTPAVSVSSIEGCLDRGVTAILCALVLVNVLLWLERLCFHTNARLS